MAENERGLTPANENPWYVLMTLYGEQDGDEVEDPLHEKNRAAWNAWSCQAMDDEARAEAAVSSRVMVAELSAWPALKAEVTELHRAAMRRRNGAGFAYPGLPDAADSVDMTNVAFALRLVMQGAVFSELAWFDLAVFSGAAVFSFATFSGQAWFGSATFSGEAGFISATFSGEAWFHSARFSGNARFNSATFSARAHFPEARFGLPGQQQEIIFIDSQFAQPTNFRDAIFQARYPDFAGAVLHDKTTFTDLPDLWPKGVQSDPAQAKASKASCATIRHSLGKQGLPEAEHFFFRREMGFAAQIGGWWQRLPYRAFGWVSDYGHSIARPAKCLFWVWFLPALAFAAFRVTGVPVSDIFEVLWSGALSFANLFPVFGFHRVWFDADKLACLPPGLKALSGAQTVVSLPLLFFLGLGLRTRFRMR